MQVDAFSSSDWASLNPLYHWAQELGVAPVSILTRGLKQKRNTCAWQAVALITDIFSQYKDDPGHQLRVEKATTTGKNNGYLDPLWDLLEVGEELVLVWCAQ